LNFIAGLVFAIIGGALIGELSSYLSSYFISPNPNYLFISVLIISAAIIFYLAYKFATHSEAVTIVYEVTILPETISNTCQELVSELKNENNPKLVNLIKDITQLDKIFSDKERLKTTGISSMRDCYQKIMGSSNEIMSDTPKQILAKLTEYLKLIEDMEKVLIQKVNKDSCIFETKKVTVSKNSEGFKVNRKNWLKPPILDIEVEPNIESSLSSVAFCHVTIYPQKNHFEYRETQKIFRQFFARVKGDQQIFELGMNFTLFEEEDFWDRFRQILSQKVDSHTDDIVKELRAFEEELEKKYIKKT